MEPAPSLLSTVSVPFIASARPREMDKPNPVPALGALNERPSCVKGEKISSSLSGGIL